MTYRTQNTYHKVVCITWLIFVNSLLIFIIASCAKILGSDETAVVVDAATPGGIYSTLAVAYEGQSMISGVRNYHTVDVTVSSLEKGDIETEEVIQVTRNNKDNRPHPVNNPNSTVMLVGPWVPENPKDIDFSQLPRIKSQHVVVSDVTATDGVNQHNYLIFYRGKYWLMWSDGPGVEDRVGQRVAYATSPDGLSWSKKQFITPYPAGSGPDSKVYNTRSTDGFRYISRGFWLREGELLALVSLDEAGGFFGESLELRAFRFDSIDNSWEDIGVVFDNTINNFSPKLLPNGEWMMTRRSFDRDVYMLTGGVESFDQWESHPVVRMGESELMPEEPYWWVLPDGNLLALFRDNARSGFLYRAFSTDMGRSWTRPVRTDFTDARSKFNGLQLTDGRFILVSNPNPEKRDPLALSISSDGMVFEKMGYLVGGRRIDYPHVIENKGHLLIAFSGGKQSVEVLKIKLDEVDKLNMPSVPIAK